MCVVTGVSGFLTGISRRASSVSYIFLGIFHFVRFVLIYIWCILPACARRNATSIKISIEETIIRCILLLMCAKSAIALTINIYNHILWQHSWFHIKSKRTNKLLPLHAHIFCVRNRHQFSILVFLKSDEFMKIEKKN